MLANIDERIKDKILIQCYNTTCVIYVFKNAEYMYMYVLTLFLNSLNVLVCQMFSGSKFQSCGPVIGVELVSDHLKCPVYRADIVIKVLLK